MKKIAAALAVLTLSMGAFAQDKPASKDTIDIVFCIDCSGSMGGVIETAKQKVWAIVNEIAKDRPKAALRIGLIGYGNGNSSYRMFHLSDDLDQVFKDLMTFKDEGWGDEWVGLAIHKATTEMKWSEAKNVLKIIFMVGNETARQGPQEFDYTKTAPAAIKKDIVVNAIYCGQEDRAGSTPTWREMAKLADGSYTEIDSQGGAVSIATPFDDDLAKLSGKLNTTYVAFGFAGEANRQKQESADEDAKKAAPAPAPSAGAADRALAKSSAQYNNSHWDLVDKCKEDPKAIEKCKEEELPAEMRKMSAEERKAFVEAKTKERAEIQAKIKELSEKREAYIKDETQKKGLTADKSFDESVRKCLREQAGRKGDAFGR